MFSTYVIFVACCISKLHLAGCVPEEERAILVSLVGASQLYLLSPPCFDFAFVFFPCEWCVTYKWFFLQFHKEEQLLVYLVCYVILLPNPDVRINL